MTRTQLTQTSVPQAAQQATAFLAGLFGKALRQGNTLHLRAFHKDRGQPPVQRWYASPQEAGEAALALGPDYDVYFGVNPRQKGNGTKAGVTEIVALHADVDFKHYSSEKAARSVLDGFELKPSILVNSGGGLQAYWLLFKPVPTDAMTVNYVESLMERLYFRLGGLDKVQDISRILRVPGTYNNKPEYQRPQVSLEVMESDRRYTLEEFEAVLPPLPETHQAALAAERDSLPPEEHEVRELLSYIPKEGRPYSEYLATLMAVHSVFPDERGVALIREWSPALDLHTGEDITAKKWRSFNRQGVTLGTLYKQAMDHGWKPKRGSEMRIARNGHKAQAEQSDSQGYSLVVRGMGDIEEREIDWLWENWLAKGMVHLLGGHPGDGKSTLTAALAATLSTGGQWPDGSKAPVGKTLFLLAEDPLDSVAVPRLKRHEADQDRVQFVEAVREPDGNERLFDLGKHLNELERVIVAEDIDLLVIDPLSAFMTGSRRNDEGDVRDMLTPLSKLAERTGVAVLGVMHVGKPSGTQRRASQQLLGSTGFVGLARVVLMVAPQSTDPQDTRRVVALTKTNLGVRPPGREWDIAGGVVTWGEETYESMEELLSGSTRGTATKGDAAETFIRDTLTAHGGSMPSKDLESVGRAAGYSEVTLRRACEKLPCTKWRGRGTKAAPWYTGLPGAKPEGEDYLLNPQDKLLIPLDTTMSKLSFSDSNGLNTTCSYEQVEQVVTPPLEAEHGQLAHIDSGMSKLSLGLPDAGNSPPNGQLAQGAHVSTNEQVVDENHEQVVIGRVTAGRTTSTGRRLVTLPTYFTPEDAAWERRYYGA